jgi:acetyl esterase
MSAKKVKIFNDGNCIVCDLEISHYYRLAPEVFELVDISDPSFQAANFGLSTEAVNRNMHIQTEEGEIKIGVDAFAHIWSRIPRYAIASRLIRLPVIYRFARAGYWVFARYRHLLPKKSRRVSEVGPKELFLDAFANSAIGTIQWIVDRISPLIARRYPVECLPDISFEGWDGNSIKVDLYRPRSEPPKGGWPLAYIIHGGGFRFFSRKSHAAIAARIADMGYLAMTVEYRLAPRHPFPAALRDVFAAFDWAHSHIRRFGGTLENCVVMGESAGGNLTLCLTLGALGFEEYSRFKPEAAPWVVPRKIIVNCGALNLQAEKRIRAGNHSALVQQRLRRIQRDYLPQSVNGTPNSEWEPAEPVSILERRTLAGERLPASFPETFIPVGDRDPVFTDSPQLEWVLTKGGARNHLRIYPGSTHGFYLMPWDPNASVCWKDIGDFLDGAGLGKRV